MKSILQCVVGIVLGLCVVAALAGVKRPVSIRQGVEPVCPPFSVQASFYDELGHGFMTFSHPVREVSLVLEPNTEASAYAILVDGTEVDLTTEPTNEAWSLTLLQPVIAKVVVRGTTKALSFSAKNFE